MARKTRRSGETNDGQDLEMEKFNLTDAQLKRLKKCVRLVNSTQTSKIKWQWLAARPNIVDEFCEKVEEELS